MNLYEYELGKAAGILANKLFNLQPGETFIITADTESDPRVVDATASAAFAAGAKPMVIWLASPLGVSEAADPMLPVAALTGALMKADAWVEFNNQWLLYSTPFHVATKENKKLRYLNLVGMNADMMVRCIGRVDYDALERYMRQFISMTANVKHVRITTPAGEDVEFDNAQPEPLPIRLGYARTPGIYMMAGQIAGIADLKTVNGTIVFDGALTPPCGKLEQPIHLTLKAGEIVNVEGGRQAKEFARWMDSFNHPQMRRVAHVCYGFNPGAGLTGNIVEDERVWGGTEWGIGHVGAVYVKPDGIYGPSHCDGISLNSSVWFDGKQVMHEGKQLTPELISLAKKLGKE